MNMRTLDDRFERVDALLRAGRVNEQFVAPEVEEIAVGGHARAARLMSVIAGAGFGGGQDWACAFDWLARAAALGDARARVELAVLTTGGAAEPDLDAWTAARPVRTVVNDPRIAMSETFVEPHLCDWLVERTKELQSPTLVYDYITGRPRPDPARTNTEAALSLRELDLVTLLIRQRIANTMAISVDRLERTSIFRYRVGQHFAPHADYLDPTSTQLRDEIAVRGQRVMTFLIYLNDDFEGGETHFIELGTRLRGRVGEALVFRNVDDGGAPDPRTLHEGAAPTAGEKWLLSQFIRDKAQAPG